MSVSLFTSWILMQPCLRSFFLCHRLMSGQAEMRKVSSVDADWPSAVPFFQLFSSLLSRVVIRIAASCSSLKTFLGLTLPPEVKVKQTQRGRRRLNDSRLSLKKQLLVVSVLFFICSEDSHRERKSRRPFAFLFGVSLFFFSACERERGNKTNIWFGLS